MTPSVLAPNREDRERTKGEIRRGNVHVVRVSSSTVRTRIAKRDEWDKQIEEDAKAGKLDDLVQEARRDHREDNTRPLP